MIESIATFQELKSAIPHLQDMEGDRAVLAWGDGSPQQFVVTCQASGNDVKALQRFEERMSAAWRDAKTLFAD